jgi:hypothetical protein
MPAHAYHLLQPLDVAVFSPLKKAYGKLLEGLTAAGTNHIDKEDFLYLNPPPRAKAITINNICNGFTGAGLKPIDEERVLEKITFQLCTPTPPPVQELISSPWNPQTPQNPHELDGQVRTLQKSLSTRKLSGSPMTHIKKRLICL